jgi:uncharacterized spore protein YtfJ
MLLGVMAGLLATGSVWAQQPPRGGAGAGAFPGGFGRSATNIVMMISNNKQLQDELKMDQDQIEKVSAAISKVREELSDEIAKMRNPDTTPEDRNAFAKKLSETRTKAVQAVLKSEQIKRLTQIENQQAGIGIFTKEEAAAALKLSAEQKEKITAIDEGMTKDLRELAAGARGNRGAPDPQAATKRQAVVKEAMEKAQAVLNDEQKKTFKDLLGEPFQLRPVGFAGGFGAGPGGAGPGGFGGGAFGGGFARVLPGQILSAPAQATLNLTDEQKKKVEELQKEVDAKLEKILTEEQNKQLKDMQQSGPRRGNRPAPGNSPPPRP